jgi:hypothetical protein
MVSYQDCFNDETCRIAGKCKALSVVTDKGMSTTN